jgi:hypothetical protein
VREGGRRDDRRVGDLDAMVHRVALLEPAQDRDGVLDAGFADEHLLEAPLQRRILLHVLAVFVERGRADAVQLAARQRRLEHVAGVHRALGLAGADHGVQLVDEQDDLALVLGQVAQHGLQALLELAAELGAGDERAHVQRQHALAAQALRDLVVDDALGQAFGDRGLAHARFADQHRVVLGPALQHLDGAADLLVAADDRVELAAFGARGQVDGVFLQRLPRLLGVLVLHALAAAHLVDRRFQHLLRGTRGLERLACLAAVLERGQQEQLAGDEGVAALLRQLVGDVEQAHQVVADRQLAGLAGHLGQAFERLAQALAQQRHVDAGLRQQRARAAALLVEQGHQQVRRFDEIVVAAHGQRLRVLQGRGEARRQLVHPHGNRLGNDGRPCRRCFPDAGGRARIQEFAAAATLAGADRLSRCASSSSAATGISAAASPAPLPPTARPGSWWPGATWTAPARSSRPVPSARPPCIRCGWTSTRPASRRRWPPPAPTC